MNGADIAFPHLGIYIPSLPKGITIGGFTIAYYGIIIASAMIAGLMLARWQAKRSGQNPEVYMDYIIFGIIFSIIGARLYYVAFQWEDYKDNLLQIFNIRGGGMAIYGSVIGAVLTAIVYCRRKKYKFSLFADTAVLGLILGQIIGRFGNFMNREAFGEYTDSLFAMRLKTDQVSLSNVTNEMWENVVTQDEVSYIQVHPTFLYEAVWNLVVLVLMIWRSKHKKFDGEIFLMYLWDMESDGHGSRDCGQISCRSVLQALRYRRCCLPCWQWEASGTGSIVLSKRRNRLRTYLPYLDFFCV